MVVSQKGLYLGENKMKCKILTVVLVFSILMSFSFSVTAQANSTFTTFRSGVNYLSSSNRFYQADSITEADFAFFKDNGITDLSIRIFWRSITEDPNVIDNYKRLLGVADKYGLNVQLDFWTRFTDDTDWARPEFLTSIFQIIRDPDVKLQWLDFVADTMHELKQFNCIKSWTMMNEPFIKELTDTALFYDCWSQQRELMKSIDSRPLSIRFSLGDSPWSEDFSKTEAFKVCDYIAINEYLDPSNSSYTRYSSTWDMFNECVLDCTMASKQLVISEFGSDTGDDEAKRLWYERSLELFREKGIPQAYAWCWQTTNPTTERFNIYPGTPAFFELSEAAGQNVSSPSLNVNIDTNRDRYTKWSYVCVTVTAADRISLIPLKDATINLVVYDTHGRIAWTATATTDQYGAAKFVYKLIFNAQMGTYQIVASVILAGYQPEIMQKTFYSIG